MREIMKDIQKAIKHFECVRDGAVAVLDSGFGTKQNESDSLYKNRKLYAELAISALEKQIPRKAVTNFVIYHCPNCNDVLADMFKRPFCDRCGQAIDWSELHPTEKGGGSDA